MTKVIDGISFPDDMSDDDIANVMRDQQQSGAGASPTAGSGGASVTAQPTPQLNAGQGPTRAAAAAAGDVGDGTRPFDLGLKHPARPITETPDNRSFRQRSMDALGSLGQATADDLRIFSAHASGGIGPALAGTEDKTAEASYRQGILGAVPATLGDYSLGWASPVEEMVGRGGSALLRGAKRVLGYGGEGAVLAGTKKAAEGKETPDESFSDYMKGVGTSALEGGLIGSGTAIAGGGFQKVGDYIGSKLPSYMGGPPKAPTTADVGPVIPGWKVGADQQRRMDLSKQLDNAAYNAKVGSSTIPNTATGLLQRNLDTGASKMTDMGFDPNNPSHKAIFAALEKQTNPSPVTSAAVAHPFVTGHLTSGIMDALATGLAFHENPAAAVGAGSIGLAGHLATMYGANRMANSAVESQLGNVRRAIGDRNGPVSQVGSVQEAMANPDWRKALQALVFNRTLGAEPLQ